MYMSGSTVNLPFDVTVYVLYTYYGHLFEVKKNADKMKNNVKVFLY